MPLLRALLISIGDELLNGHVVNSNARCLGGALLEVGIPLEEERTVRDDRRHLRRVVEDGVSRSPLVLTSGGLGPTPDDCTREVLAEVAGEPLVESARVRGRLEELAARLGRHVTEEAARQALLPAGAELLDNPIGMAPGLWLRVGQAIVCALPGVPVELETMTRESLLPRLRALPGRQEACVRTLRTVGVPESELDRALRRADLGPVALAYLPGTGAVDLRLSALGPGATAAVEHALEEAGRRLGAALGPVVFGGGDDDLAAVVEAMLRRMGWRIAVAESCTGGLVAKRLTDVAGSSEVFDQGLVTYSNASKQALLGVPAELIERHGAVSAEVASAMAAGARRQGAELGLAVTGIAGPGGGTPEKPVGLVHVAVAGPSGARSRALRLSGSRRQIRERTAMLALDQVRRYILSSDRTPGRDAGARPDSAPAEPQGKQPAARSDDTRHGHDR